MGFRHLHSRKVVGLEDRDQLSTPDQVTLQKILSFESLFFLYSFLAIKKTNHFKSVFFFFFLSQLENNLIYSIWTLG